MNMKRETKCGTIQGTSCQWEGIEAYKGIRYATAKRWEYPIEVTAWDGIYDATKYGACSVQPRTFYDEELNEGKVFYYHEFRKGETYEYSEDCLFLNIWTREDAKEGDKLPVIFYIHGGGFTGGCGHEKHFDGPIWPTLQNGCVAVTINYRLGVLGFACLEELKDSDGFTGNYGLYDQMMAMQWVKHNIAAFGGDPENITIMGQSAGAMSVQQHVLSPLTKGLFQKAILSSGCMVSKIMKASKAEERFEFWQAVMTATGAKTIQEFKEVDVEKLFEVVAQVKKEKKVQMVEAPVIDGRLVVTDSMTALENGNAHDIPYIVGLNAEDIFPPMLDSGNKAWAKIMSQRNTSKVYRYFFNRRLPGDDNGTWHSADLWYWFGTLKNCWRPMEEKDFALSDEFANRLVAFATTGEPTYDKGVAWTDAKANGKEVLLIGEGQTRMGHTKKLSLIKTMLTNKAVGE